MRAIELADLGRAYGERVALAGVTLSLEEGETLAVFGSNGAGNPPAVRVRSSGAGEFEAAAEQSLYFGRICFGMVVANSLPGDIARDFMQIQGDGQTFFAGHDPVALDLLVEGSCRGHYVP